MGDGSHWTIVRVALASGVLQTIATMATMQRTPGEPGLERYPFLGSVNVLSMLVALYSQDLTPGQLLTVAGGLAATTAIGLVLAPKPLVWIDFISGLLWTGASVVSVARMNSLFGEDADSMVAGLTEQDEARLRHERAAERQHLLLPSRHVEDLAIEILVANLRPLLQPVVLLFTDVRVLWNRVDHWSFPCSAAPLRERSAQPAGSCEKGDKQVSL